MRNKERLFLLGTEIDNEGSLFLLAEGILRLPIFIDFSQWEAHLDLDFV